MAFLENIQRHKTLTFKKSNFGMTFEIDNIYHKTKQVSKDIEIQKKTNAIVYKYICNVDKICNFEPDVEDDIKSLV